MCMTEEKMLHTEMEGKRPRERSRTRWIDQIRNDMEMKGKKLEEIQECGRIEMMGDFVIVDKISLEVTYERLERCFIILK